MVSAWDAPGPLLVRMANRGTVVRRHAVLQDMQDSSKRRPSYWLGAKPIKAARYQSAHMVQCNRDGAHTGLLRNWPMFQRLAAGQLTDGSWRKRVEENVVHGSCKMLQMAPPSCSHRSRSCPKSGLQAIFAHYRSQGEPSVLWPRERPAGHTRDALPPVALSSPDMGC